MSNDTNFDGPNWRENPRENTPPVKRGDSFLASRGYKDPSTANLKFQIVDAIRMSTERLLGVLAALGNRVCIVTEAVDVGQGCLIMEQKRRAHS
jgi:hypothetical protein